MAKKTGLFLICIGVLAALSGLFINFILNKLNSVVLVSTVLPFLIFTNLGISLRFINQRDTKREKASHWLLGIGLFITTFGLFNRYFLFLPGASVEVIIGISVLCFAYGPLLTKNRLEKWLPYASSRRQAIALALVDFFSVTFIFLGLIFIFQYWPAGEMLFYFGLLLLLVSIKFWNNVFKKEIIYRKQAEEKLEKQKKIVEEKNREITDSIEYALRIQTAILPPQKTIKKYLENSFILYKPKDIVAGDFYWMETIEELVLFAACDCTGHGVPGAMVSVVCYNALNRTVKEFGLTETGRILDKVTELVLETFEKNGEEIKDGMDISLLSINRTTNQVQWSGANNPLWIVNGTEFNEIKADKQPIGKSEERKLFTTHSIPLIKGETFYLITDGYADQFSIEDKKLMKKKFKETILSIQDKSMAEQGKFLEDYHTKWKGQMEQTDDVTVIGIKL